jgi:hypothetical protein
MQVEEILVVGAACPANRQPLKIVFGTADRAGNSGT